MPSGQIIITEVKRSRRRGVYCIDWWGREREGERDGGREGGREGERGRE